MARQRDPNRDKAFQLYKKRRGNIAPKEIAEKLGISAKTVREWKCRDKWDESLHRRGAPRGNQNAVGNAGGAPKGNTNAETHGAYSYPRMEQWCPEERKRIEDTQVQFDTLAEHQLKALLAKQHDLERRISELTESNDKSDSNSNDNSDDSEQLYLDRIMTMKMPDGGEMKYRSESSAFSRRMTLESELNRVHGRVQKLLDSIRAREDSQERLKFEREKFEFGKQKALGEFRVDDTGKILTDTQKESDEIIET